MKKVLINIFFMSLAVFFLSAQVNAETNFSRAIATCEDFNQKEIIVQNNEAYNVSVSLEKGKKNNCIYKEKITIGKNTHLLTCTFDKKAMTEISQLMSDFSNRFKSHMIKNPIYEAKLSTNAEIFQRYLTDIQYCKISGQTH